MSSLDLAAELGGLEHGLDLFLREQRPELVSISTDLRRSVGLRTGDVTWPGSFAPLVSLYPLIQAEPFLDRLDLAARQACLPHILLLVHTFIEDRHLDQQRPASRGELLFSKQLFCDGQMLLRTIADEAKWVQPCIDRSIDTYGRSELFSFPLRAEDDSWPTVRWAVAGRAKLAGVAYQCLLRLAEASDAQLAAADAAFDALVVGLQWEDDLVDWRDDLATASDNLVLWRLECRGNGEPPPADAIARLMEQRGAARDAVAAARSEWRRAADLQRELGAETMARLIEERIVRLEALGERTLETI